MATVTNPLDRTRLGIAEKVRVLRAEHRLTQAEVSRRLGLSQGRLSKIERGAGSFSAEQFIAILKLFNVGASYFEPAKPKDPHAELTNALARFGASQLRETAALPSDDVSEVSGLVRATLIAGSPRLVSALAPVIVNNVDRLALTRLHVALHEVGLERRLAWLVENILAALKTESSDAKGKTGRAYARAATVLGAFRDFVESSAATATKNAPVDVLDPDIRSPQTLEEVQAEASTISRRWRIATALTPADFARALRQARAG